MNSEVKVFRAMRQEDAPAGRMRPILNATPVSREHLEYSITGRAKVSCLEGINNCMFTVSLHPSTFQLQLIEVISLTLFLHNVAFLYSFIVRFVLLFILKCLHRSDCRCSEFGVESYPLSFARCDDATGQCRCGPRIVGRTCNECELGYSSTTEKLNCTG